MDGNIANRTNQLRDRGTWALGAAGLGLFLLLIVVTAWAISVPEGAPTGMYSLPWATAGIIALAEIAVFAAFIVKYQAAEINRQIDRIDAGAQEKGAEKKGHFFVNKNRAWGPSARYAVLLTADRLIFMKTGGEFGEAGPATITGSVMGGMLGGFIGGALDSRLRQPREDDVNERLAKYHAVMEEQILRADKANFVLRFEDIAAVRLKRAGYNFAYQKPRAGVMTIELPGKKPERYDIAKQPGYEEVAIMLRQALPDKVQLEDDASGAGHVK
jgi:hypothetical protein